MTYWRSFALLVCLGASACERTKQSAKEAPAPAANPPEEVHASPGVVRIADEMLRDLRISTTRVESRRGAETVTLLGELAMNERAYAEVSAPVPATVARVVAELGDDVRVGEPLLVLRSTEVGEARSAYLTAIAQRTLAENALRRKRSLANERIAPEREVQEAEAAAMAARHEVQAAKAMLSAIGVDAPAGGGEENGATLVLRAPVRGTVIERKAVRGQRLEAGTVAFRIGSLDTLWLIVHAFERDVVRIHQGGVAQVSFAALPGEAFTGRVTMVGRQVMSESRTVEVRLDVPNRNQILRPGMSGSASVPIGAGDAPILTVPVAALQRLANEWCVFTPQSNRIFQVRKVGRGRDLGGEVELLSGVAAGDLVVVEGAFLLKAQAEKSETGHDDH